MKTKVDLIIYNTKIYTVDDKDSIAQCVAISDSMIVAVGSDAEIRSRFRASNYINAKGLFVYPGFIDAHSHFTGYAKFLNFADLTEANSFSDVLKIIEDYHDLHPDRWIIGRGWDQNKWPGKNYPDNLKLNKLFPNTPVILTRVDGHALLANQAAIKAAGIEEPFPTGEAMMQNQKYTGVFLERTADKIREAIPKPTKEQFKELLDEAAELCFAAGITGVNDAGLHKEEILFLDSLQKSGSAKIRIDAMINPTEENLSYFMKKDAYRSPFLRVGSLKIYADGALGSRGACLLEPYSDDSLNYGILVTSENEMRTLCKAAIMHSFQVCTHAIGDSAVRMVLKVYSEVLKEKNDLRWRIEHAQVVAPDDIPTFGNYSIIPSIQATHATSDMGWVKSRLGNVRAKNAYAYKTLMLQNGWLPNGTDFPVEKISPILTFYAAVARKDVNGFPRNGFQAENALSRVEALKSITIWAARAAFEDVYKGSIQVGKYADLVILDKDLMNMAENDIPATGVKYTILNGLVVFEDKSSNKK